MNKMTGQGIVMLHLFTAIVSAVSFLLTLIASNYWGSESASYWFGAGMATLGIFLVIAITRTTGEIYR